MHSSDFPTEAPMVAVLVGDSSMGLRDTTPIPRCTRAAVSGIELPVLQLFTPGIGKYHDSSVSGAAGVP